MQFYQRRKLYGKIKIQILKKDCIKQIDRAKIYTILKEF